jgi:cation:H+ antiporter
MDIAGLSSALLTLTATSLVVMVACSSFGKASSYLGKHVYKMPAGVRGATIDAIGSSMPELFTTTFLLFFYTDLDGFSAGIATCAGSAVFNAVIIPALCILVVTNRGILVNGTRIKLAHLNLQKSTIMRDAFFFLIAEVTLIAFLDSPEVGWKMGAALLLVYCMYAIKLFTEIRSNGGETKPNEPKQTRDTDHAPDRLHGVMGKLIRLDFNGLLFGGRPFTPSSAWTVLSLATITVAIACHFLAGAVMDAAAAMDIAPYFAAIILGAAATSVPDTVISVRAAAAGDYDDAISNAMGSNIFDICIALGLPLLVYSLWHGGISVPLSSAGGPANVQELRVALVLLTILVVCVFLYDIGPGERVPGKIRMGKTKAVLLLSFYITWTVFIFGRSFEWEWMAKLTG